MALCDAAKKAMQLRQFLIEIDDINVTPNINVDNQSAIRLIKNTEHHKRTNHIGVRYHYVRERYEASETSVSYISTDEQISDGLTKALSKDKFLKFRYKIIL